MKPLLRIENLSKSFFSKQGRVSIKAVDRASFQQMPGETIGIVGESGCGKSTLGRTILRLLEPDQGQVWFKGENLLNLSPREMRRKRLDMQLIFQDPFASLDPRQNIKNIISEPFQIHGIGNTESRKIEVMKLLATVGLPEDAADRYPHEFSGGQRQRISIARAIALKPTLIVADEPVSALDVSIQAQILNLLIDLREQLGLSYLFISHDLAVIRNVSDRVAVMYLGRIVELAPVDVIFSSPRHPYTQALITAIPRPDPEQKYAHVPLLGDLPDPEHLPQGCPFHPRCPQAKEVCRQEDPPKVALASSDNSVNEESWVRCHLV